MSTFGKLRAALTGAVLLVAMVAALPAQAEPAESGHTGWIHREDASASGSDQTFEVSTVSAHDGVWEGVRVSNAGDDGPLLGANFIPPAGQALQAGKTYRAVVSENAPTPEAGRVDLWRDYKMCGKTRDDLFVWGSPPPAVGWFHVSELEYDPQGRVTRFAATYGINCQYVGGPPGFEGSVAVNSSVPSAPVPAAPVTPGPVGGLTVENVGPNGGGQNSTTLTWTKPAGSHRFDVDMVQWTDRSALRALLGWNDTHRYRGSDARYHEWPIEFEETRTYRVVARGASGRLGPPAFVTVLGTRLSIPDMRHRITIGEALQVSGRLSESWDYVDVGDVMKGPGLAGRKVVLCEQSSIKYVDGDCTAVDRTTTTTDGHFTLSATPRENSLYTVRVPARRDMLGNTSHVVNTLVAPHTDLRSPDSSRARARTSAQSGALLHFTTSRAPAGSRGFVRLQRRDGQKWRTIATRSLSTAAGTRRLAITYRENVRGRNAYRVVKPGDARHVNGRSRIVRIRVP